KSGTLFRQAIRTCRPRGIGPEAPVRPLNLSLSGARTASSARIHLSRARAFPLINTLLQQGDPRSRIAVSTEAERGRLRPRASILVELAHSLSLTPCFSKVIREAG